MSKIKKYIAVLLIILLFVGRAGFAVAYAQEGETTDPPPSPTATPTPSPSVTPSPALEEFASQEESPTATPTPSPSGSSDVDNEADVEDDVGSTAISGENEITEASPSATPTPSLIPTASPQGESATQDDGCQEEEGCGEGQEGDNEDEGTEIETGDAVSVSETENSVNTTEVNSSVLFQTLNIYVPQDVDLSISPLEIADDVLNKDENNDEEINVKVLDGVNYAYLKNDIESVANTGDNSIEDEKNSKIKTGDAYSIVSLLNKVNTTVVDSRIHIVTINIFGEVEGNILLPDVEGDENCCGGDLKVSNSAVVKNNVDSEAVSGQNSIETDSKSTDGAEIETGDATSVVNIKNVVNATFRDTIFGQLYINVLGSWLGDFLGWGDIGSIEGGESLTLSSSKAGGEGGGCEGCVGDASLENHAYVENNVSSSANTGNNSISGEGASEINTGNAYSSVSIFNLINTSIIDSVGFFGSVNIFGTLRGNIGGASFFEVEKEEDEEPEEETVLGDDTPSPRESGGELEIYQYNNVNDFVYPGDTVTFFVDIRNPGTGKVYDAVLEISLIKEGVDMGGVTFDVGDIKKGEGYRVVTGIELSGDVEPGRYLAHAEVKGFIGPADKEVSAYSDSFIQINGSSFIASSVPEVLEEVDAAGPGEVLGFMPGPAGLTKEQKMILIFLALLAFYLPAKGYEKRREISIALSKSGSFIEKKSLALRSFLTSFLA